MDITQIHSDLTLIGKKFGQEGNSSQVDTQTNMLKYIADKGAEMTYCEIGFNSGHSAATVLSTNPHSKW